MLHISLTSNKLQREVFPVQMARGVILHGMDEIGKAVTQDSSIDSRYLRKSLVFCATD